MVYGRITISKESRKRNPFADGLDTLHTYYSSNGNKLKEGKMVDKGRGNWTFYDENGVKERETEHKSGGRGIILFL